MSSSEAFDVLIVGAGISGVSAAYHLQTRCPGKTYAILEGRDRMGGTWDLFRYPGIRSDSDMYTLGFSFRPWTDPKAIADGPSILAYVRETAAMYGIDKHIRYGQNVKAARWSSDAARWTVTVDGGNGSPKEELTCRFLFACAGYYHYDEGYTPEFPGRERFKGQLVHPQKWTPDVDYEGKRVVVIGSGATAVTLVPELAKKASHVTMLQRSPTYIVSAPSKDPLATWLRERVASETAYSLTRWKNVLLAMGIYGYTRGFPEHATKVLVGHVAKRVGKDVDWKTHFVPKYKPWDQRLCLVPDGDLFKAIRRGTADVVTDQIETFTESGIQLRSGRLPADLIVTATGLRLRFLGGIEVTVDGEKINPAETFAYKGMMLSNVPNLALAIGYTNASWTLKCDLTSAFVCRLLNHMDRKGFDTVVPRQLDPGVKDEPLLSFSSGYVQRSIREFPRQGSVAPWRVYQNYALDLLALRHGKIDDGKLAFSKLAQS